MNPYKELVKRQEDLKFRIKEIDKKIYELQRTCKHQDTDVDHSYDGYEQRNYTDYTCKECGYHWSER